MNKSQCSILVLFIITLSILACGDTGGSKSTDPAKISGSRIYNKFCKQCHGAKGDLGLNGAASFRDSKLTLEERIDVIANGRKTMLPHKGILSAAKIKAVAEYTLKLK